MKKGNFLLNLNQTIHKVGFKVKKHSPAILVGAGVVGVVVSTVMACKATTKVNDILEETKDQVNKIHTCMEDEELLASGTYSEKDGKKDLTIVYTQTGLKLVKLYAPSVAVGALSIASILASHHILNKRNIAITAAYAAVDKGYKDYRKRVRERFGEQVDKELKYNIKAEEVSTTEVTEDGQETTVTTQVGFVDADGVQYSEYAKFFDECNPNWQRDAEYNLMFLKQTEAFANQKLRANGYLFLNDVYDMLGIPRTKAGQAVGWVYDEVNPIGDNYVDFGIYDVNKRRAQDFVNGYEKSILLDFNVDGIVWDHLR